MRRVSRQVESPQAIKASGTIDFKIPNTVKMLLALSIMLSGGAPLTISSGTAVFKQGSFLNSFFSSINFSKGTTNIKAAPADFFRMFQGAVEKKFTPLYSNASAALTAYSTSRLTGYASPPTGTTGQYHNYLETLKIYFEMMYLNNEIDRLKTGVNTIGADEFLLQFNCQSLETAIKGVGNTASITWGALTDLKISVELEEMVEESVGEFARLGLEERNAFFQIAKPYPVTADLSDKKINNLVTTSCAAAGLWLIMRDNAAGTATTSTGNIRNDAMITKVEVNVDDARLLARSTWRQLKDKLRSRWGYQADESGGVGEDYGVSGVAFCDGKPDTLVPLSKDNNLGLIFSSASQATATDYGSTGTAQLRYMVDYVAPVPV